MRSLVSPAAKRVPDHVQDFWEELAAKSDTPDPASGGPVWQLTAYGHSHCAEWPIIVRQTPDSQIAFSLTGSMANVQFRPLESHWGFGCPLLGPNAVELLQDSIAKLQSDPDSRSIALSIPGLTPGGLHLKQLLAAFPTGRIVRQDAHAAASLEGGFDGWLSRRSGNFRHKLKRSKRKARERGLYLERHAPTTESAANALYQRMLDVEHRSWKGPLEEGLLALKSFYGELLNGYAQRGAARVLVARWEDQDAGFCFGGLSHGIYRGQQTSYAEAWRDASLGLIMHAETARWLCDEGAALQHFGPVQRGMSYKASFCEQIRPSLWVRAPIT